ncbi:MAG: DegQ family serine endoprotease [Lentisphaerae bacterium]|nr:DegQ family serine endoprotease [Lentisphaerota bacterium]
MVASSRKGFLFPAALAAATLGLLVTGAPCRAVEGKDILRQTSAAFTRIAKEAVPAVVSIKVEKTVNVGNAPELQGPFEPFDDEFFNFFFGRPRQRIQPRRYMQMGQGSGFLISDDGYILTNHHVAGGADKIAVRLTDGREFNGKVVGTDEKTEVALIKIEGKDLPHLKLGDSDSLEIGEWVLAIGNPFGLSESVTAGIVSAKGRSGIGIADYESFIQTDAAINPGNSGGPMLNLDGEVVGINTAIFSRSGGYMGIGFAVPINMARQVKDQLAAGGKVKRGYLGIYIQEMTRELAESFGMKEAEGILVAGFTPSSPAEKAGIETGDVILELNGKTVRDLGSFRNTVAAMGPGAKTALKIAREGKHLNIEVITSDLDDENGAAEGGEPGVDIGLQVQELTPEIAGRLGPGRSERGVVVSDVEQGSAAWNAGIRPGMVITSVNRKPVSSVRDFHSALADARKVKSVLLRVRLEQGSRFVVIPIE